MAVRVFGEVDRNKENKVISDYPAWYFDGQHTEDLEESVASAKRQLESDLIPTSDRHYVQERVKVMEEKLGKIKASKPKLSAQETDELAKARKDFGTSIKDAMFTRSDMMKGIADPHEEARRISEPCIKVKSEAHAEFLKACGARIEGDKVSRGDMEKAWKIASKLLGESSNTEGLR